jgi:hypothetical protein
MNKIKLILIFFVGVGMLSCAEKKVKTQETYQYQEEKSIILDLKAANNLIKLPLACVLQEYPNKLGHVVGDKVDLLEPRDLHPSFYGCFDWHSAVHGHWSLVKLLKDFPDVENKVDAISKLRQNISKENVLKEIEYFEGHNKSYERTYGWAWLLKLAEELHTWEGPLARELEANLQPLTDMIVDKYSEFFPKLVYPIRVGEHTNTAFGMSFALDYAKTVGNTEFESLLKNRAKDYYQDDHNCPITWEPSGFDFLSPCLEEASLMSRVLPKDIYMKWLDQFLPQLKDSDFKLDVGKVSDRSDGKLVHLDGVNFSRAWCLKSIAEKDKKYNHLITVANKHIQNSLPSLVGDSYEGGHWLGSFAIYACQ